MNVFITVALHNEVIKSTEIVQFPAGTNVPIF